jgi:hypothetical protein
MISGGSTHLVRGLPLVEFSTWWEERRGKPHNLLFSLSVSVCLFLEHPTPHRLELNRVALSIYGTRCDRTHFRSARTDIGACPSVCMG